MTTRGQRLQVLSGNYAVCRLAAGSKVPEWAKGEFVSVTLTSDEVSVICLAHAVPAGVQSAADWRVFKVTGPFPLSTVGVMASLATPLAKAGISLLTVGTYDTDYLLVKESMLHAAVVALTVAGHEINGM